MRSPNPAGNNDGSWLPATRAEGGITVDTWTIWSLDWDQPANGEHAITTLAIDVDGNIQPAKSEPEIANKLTYWESYGQISRRVAIGARSFPETGHTLSGAFLTFREQDGGLATFGYPITEAFEENCLTVQYFERARFEHHQGNEQPYDVLLGLLGYETLEARYGGNLPPGAV